MPLKRYRLFPLWEQIVYLFLGDRMHNTFQTPTRETCKWIRIRDLQRTGYGISTVYKAYDHVTVYFIDD